MIPTPVPSIEEALQCVCNNTTNEVRRVVLWFSESHATPLSPALQLRLAIELSRYCATHYPAVVQYVVATPSIGSRHDVWTFGLIKILAQMQVLLPHARLVVCQRGSRNITDIDVYYLKLYLRDHCHLNLWSRYDADTTLTVEASYTASTQQQQATQATNSADRPAAEAPVASRSRNQRRAVPAKDNVTPKNGTTHTATRTRSACPSDKAVSRQRRRLQDGSATQPIVKHFPPPPSGSRFHTTLLRAHSRSRSVQGTSSITLVNTGRARTSKTHSSETVPLIVKEKAKPCSCGKTKEHHSRDEAHRRPTGNRVPPAPADASLKAASQSVTNRRAICAFCALPHWASQCTTYRSTAHRVWRVRELGYCSVCLRTSHADDVCTSRSTSRCQLCQRGHHHRALCPLATSTIGRAKQVQPRQPSLSARSTDVPAATKVPSPTGFTEAHQHRQSRKRKDRKPRK